MKCSLKNNLSFALCYVYEPLLHCNKLTLLLLIVDSFRIFSIAAVVCNFLVLPLNYFGKEMERHHVPAETLEVFTIVNVEEGSRWYEMCTKLLIMK